MYRSHSKGAPTRAPNSLLTQAEERTPLKLLTELNPDDLTTVKLEQFFTDDTKKKADAPTHSMESLETVLYCLNEFREIADRFAYDPEDQFTNYHLTLKNHARTTWTSITQNRNHNSQAEFDASIQEFIATVATHDAFERLQEYLMLATKPRSMSPKDVVNRLRTIGMYAKDLPGAPTNNPWTETQLKRMVLSRMMAGRATLSRPGNA